MFAASMLDRPLTKLLVGGIRVPFLALACACGPKANAPLPADASEPPAAASTAHEHGPPHGADQQESRHAPHGGHHTSRSHHFEEPERYAAEWNDPERDAWQKPEEIVAALGIRTGATVVDLGAGTGYLLPSLSRAVGPQGEVIAADIEASMLAFLDDAVKAEDWGNVRTHLSRTDSLGLPAASVDGMVALNVWHHVENREAYARGLLQVLRPGGVFLVVDYLAEPTEGFGPPLEMRLTAEQVASELTSGGFQVELVPETMPRHYMVRGIRP